MDELGPRGCRMGTAEEVILGEGGAGARKRDEVLEKCLPWTGNGGRTAMRCQVDREGQGTLSEESCGRDVH